MAENRECLLFTKPSFLDVMGSKRPANETIDRLVERYGRLEQQVRLLTEQLCRPACSACRRVCCRIDFCLEARESIFLTRVVDRFSPDAVFDPTSGWLTRTGCALVAGRPPVCYEFLCGEIPDAVSADHRRRHAMLVLSMLLTHAGRKVACGRHLVEIVDGEGLHRIQFRRFNQRLDEAEEAFAAADAILRGGGPGAGTQTLTRIVSSPRMDKRRLP
jgi:hypothetical protein